MLFADLPRIRLDKVLRTRTKIFREAPPILMEEPEDGLTDSEDTTTISDNIQLNLALQNMSGMWKI